MEEKDLEKFIKAIKEKRIISVKFNSQDKGEITRKCLPFDFGPWRRKINPNPDRYHLYDLDSPDGQHNLSILPDQIIEISLLDEYFDPANYINWTPSWFIIRDWGIYS
jgi:hypothetical protein